MQEISEITRGLKGIAKELDVPVIALSQLSRQVENRDDKRPQLADLRESGSIEQDADVVLFAHRDEYYLAKKEPWNASRMKARKSSIFVATSIASGWKAYNKAEVIIGKQRHGPTGLIDLHFEKSLTKFSDLTDSISQVPEGFDPGPSMDGEHSHSRHGRQPDHHRHRRHRQPTGSHLDSLSPEATETAAVVKGRRLRTRRRQTARRHSPAPGAATFFVMSPVRRPSAPEHRRSPSNGFHDAGGYSRSAAVTTDRKAISRPAA